MKHSRSGILIPFSRNVALSSITHLLFTIASTSCYSISINLHCAYAIICTSMAYYTFNCTSMNSCSSCTTMFSSLMSFCIVYASTKWCSSTSSSSDSSMYTRSISVAPSLVYSLTCQCCLLLHKNSIVDVPVVSMFGIIICVNFIFTLYAFLLAHSEDDDECDNDLKAND